jgi:hypothetical protein
VHVRVTGRRCAGSHANVQQISGGLLLLLLAKVGLCRHQSATGQKQARRTDEARHSTTSREERMRSVPGWLPVDQSDVC